MNQNEELVLPLGYKFRPTPTELIVHYVRNKNLGRQLPADLIPTFDCFSCNPDQIPFERFTHGIPNEWYFFCNKRKDEIIIIENGYYIVSDDNYIYDEDEIVGSVRTMDFYYGKPPSGIESQWKIEEYRAIPFLHPRAIVGNMNSSVVACKVIRKEDAENEQ